MGSFTKRNLPNIYPKSRQIRTRNRPKSVEIFAKASFYLCSTLSERNLKLLNLYDCGIGGPGAAALVKCLPTAAALEALYLENNQLDETDVEELKTAWADAGKREGRNLRLHDQNPRTAAEKQAAMDQAAMLPNPYPVTRNP